MYSTNKTRRHFTKIVSLLLTFAVMLSIAIPINVFAEETVAENNDIYAVLYYINPNLRTSDGLSINNTKNIELVFQKGNTLNPNKTVVTDKNGNKGIFSVVDNPTTYTGTANNVPVTAWFGFNSTSSNQNIVKVDFKDKIRPTNIDGWFRNCINLPFDSILHKENLDTSKCTSMSYTFAKCNQFTTFDFSKWENLDFSKVQSMHYMFGECSSLYTIDLSGIDPVNCTTCQYMFYKDASLKSVKFGTFKAGNNVKPSTGTKGVNLNSFFAGCKNLETVDMTEIELDFPNNTGSMFENCTSITEIDVSKMYGNTPIEGFTTSMKAMFKGCTSLEVLNYNLFPHTLGYVNVESLLSGCVSLREFYLENAKGTNNRYNPNIFVDTKNLSYVSINDKWKSVNWIPAKETWTKVKMSKTPVANEVPVGTVLSNTELFNTTDATKRTTYAGAWAAETDFAFNANGGAASVDGVNTEVQFVNGTKNTALDYSSVITPTRNGYSFNGWHKNRVDNSPFVNGDIAEQWTYYAHWVDNEYKLILNANGGYISNSDDTKIEYDNIKYSELKKLDKNAFVNDDGKVLVGWNTAADGSGKSFAADDSVSMLTTTNDGEVTLYAMWHSPKATVSFDAHGGSDVEDKQYDNLPEVVGTLSDSQRNGYTFLGWYTEEIGGTKVEETTPVVNSCTLHAHWEKNPVVVYDAGDGYFNNDETKKTINKIYKYNSYIGVMPTPENGSAQFLGWYEEGSDIPVDSTYEVKADTLLTAHWGYIPKFDTDGGIISIYPTYEAQTEPVYTLSELPTVTKENYTFLGWKHGDDWVWKSDVENSSVAVDLSQNNVIKAIWQQKEYYNITLNANGGTLKSGEINPIKVYKDKPIAALPVPTRDGYDFEGWYLGEAKKDRNSTFNKDETLIAKWSQKNCTVTFNAGEGITDNNTKEKTISVVQGKTIPSIPGANLLNEDGAIKKSFDGWYTEENGNGEKLTKNTIINKNITYYAYFKEDTQTDATNKYSYYVQWNTPSDSRVTDTGNRLVYHPLGGGDLSAGLKVVFQAGDKIVPKGALKVKIPKYIFKDWNNKPIISNNAAGNDTFDVDKTSDSEYYIFTNKTSIQSKGVAFTIDYQFSPININGGYIDKNGYYHDGYINDDFDVNIEVDMDNDGTLETDYTKKLAAEVHTKVDTSVAKFRSNVSLSWNDNWGAKPADADEYFYVEWKLNSNHVYSNYNQNFYLKWDENTVRNDGTVIYADKYVSHGDTEGQWTSLQYNGSKSFTVVTKHRRDLARPAGGDQWATVSNEAILNVKWRSGYTEQFRTNASTTAYIPPTGDGSYSFQKEVPEMNNNESHYSHGGQELIINREEENMPVLPYEISYNESVNSNNPEWNERTSKYTAPKREMTLVDGERGDVVISSNSGNYSTDSWSNSTPLDDSDYYFDSLKISLTEYDATKLGSEWSNPYEHSLYSDYSETQIWVRKMNSDTFTLHKELVITPNETTIALPKDTVGYKIIHSSEFFTTNILVKTNLCLKPTSKLATIVSKDIANNNKTLIKNKSRFDIVCNEKTTSFSSDKNTWPCTYILDLSATQLYARKNCASQNKVIMNETTMSEDIPVVVSGWGYNNSGNKRRFVDGEIYDMLPKNFSVDKNTIFVKPILENWNEKDYENKKISANKYDTEITSDTLSKSAYSVRFVNNWEDSGRTMMIVRVNIPETMIATGVHVYFKMSSRFSNIYANGTTQSNMAAFKDNTPNIIAPEKRTSRLEDNAIEPNYKKYFTKIDGDQTAFASANTNCKIPPIHESGFDLTANTESVSTKHLTVGLNNDYSYNISYGSGIGVYTDDLVFYDVIEHRLDNLKSEWEGHFKGVDISSLRNTVNALDEDAHCEPVVYYAVKNGSNPKPKESFVFDSAADKDDFDLDNAFWTTELPENLDDVTAVAVDCRLDNKGNPFRLYPESTVEFNINMSSPKEPDTNNVYTYNEAITKLRMSDTNTKMTLRTQTDILLHYNMPTISKEAFPISGTEDNPTKVVKNSTMDYTLKINNPDNEVSINGIVVNDDLDAKLLKINDSNIRVKIDDNEVVNINNSVHINSYSLKRENDVYKFTASLNTLDANESLSIIIPVTVIGEKNNTIVNEAKITQVYDNDYNITSNKTYHIIDDPQVKILKVNSKDEALAGAKFEILNDNATKNRAEIYDNNNNPVGEFTTTENMLSYSIQPGRYILHEISTPNDDIYKTAEDIKFRIDSDGFVYIDGKKTDYIKVVNVPAYKVVFHENQPNADDEIFRIYEPSDLDKDLKISHFYDIPTFADDEYVFAGWYSSPEGGTPVNFENDTYPKRDIENPDYHIYAHWIKVGTVEQDTADKNVFNGSYRGFGVVGVQIRADDMYDSNYETETKGGMRFITSFSETLLNQINAVSTKKVNTPEGNVDVEYGYAVATEESINKVVEHYNVEDTTKYKIQYKGENVNGVNTTLNGKADADFRYISNINCTKGTGQIKKDHRNYKNYRLYTLVVTYNESTDAQKKERLDARAYIRYYDANGKLRVFYNNYKKNLMFGGCLCSYNQAVAGIFNS